MVAALLVISRAGQGGALLSPLSAGLVATCAGALALLAAQERRASFPMLPPRLFAEPVAEVGGGAAGTCRPSPDDDNSARPTGKAAASSCWSTRVVRNERSAL